MLLLCIFIQFFTLMEEYERKFQIAKKADVCIVLAFKELKCVITPTM